MQENIESIKEEKPDEEKKEIEIDLDEIAKEYAEKLRGEIEEMKKDNADPHLKYVNPRELTYDDLIIFDKAKKNELTAPEFMDYSERLKQYFKEQKHSEKENQIKEQINELKNKHKTKEISGEEFKEKFRNLLREYDKEKSGGYEAAGKSDSRATFEAMIHNWLISSGKM